MSNNDAQAPVATLPLDFGGFTITTGSRRIFISAELEPSNGNPLIQPTGFPDVGPVLYPDPAEKEGLICLIESEASMANRLEEVCFANEYEGALKKTFDGLPYLAVKKDGQLVTTSTLDGHRFASDFLATCTGKFSDAQDTAEQSLADHIKKSLGMNAEGTTMPIANLPKVFPLVMCLDTMSLIHGFQISNKQISFVGLRLPRALSASIIGFGCDRVSVPGVKFNVGQVDSDSGQAIFQKPRITAKRIEARFSIDVGLISSLRLDDLDEKGEPGPRQAVRAQLLLAIAIWKVAAFLDLLSVELSLRTECKLRLKKGIKPKAICEDGMPKEEPKEENEFPFLSIYSASLNEMIRMAKLPEKRSPLTLQSK